MMSCRLSLIGRSSSAGSPFRTNWALKVVSMPMFALHALMDAILGAAAWGILAASSQIPMMLI